jgi:5S rRNA maturation endonuclease (ribonuclease M5)
MIKRVCKDHPCPICGSDHWCGLTDDEALAICMRVSEGSIRTTKNGGFLHVLKDRDPAQSRTLTKTIEIEPKQDDFEYRRLNSLMRISIDEQQLDRFAKALGLSVGSLHRLQVGWYRRWKVWSFPMYAPNGRIIGFRLRTPTGKKFSIPGGHEGLFIPRELKFDDEQLFICEGPTDTAACLDFGFNAIGRPSCHGAVNMTVKYVRQHYPLDVIIVADSDAPGQRGATNLAKALLGVARTIRIITPPDGIKDIREWKRRGATREDALLQVEKVLPLQLQIGRSA